MIDPDLSRWLAGVVASRAYSAAPAATKQALQAWLADPAGAPPSEVAELFAAYTAEAPEQRSAAPASGKRFATLGDDPSDDDVQRFVDFLKR